MKNLSFYLLVLLLMFTTNSCHKNDHDNYNAYSIAEEEAPIQNQLTPEEEKEALHQQTIESMGLMFELFNPLFREIIKNPGLLLLTGNGNIAQVRTGCPCTDVTDTAGGFPKTLTLTFDDGGGSCTITEATGGTTKTYSGTLEFVFATGLNDGDLTLKQVTNFTVDDYSFTTTQDWTWDIEGSGGGVNPAAGMDTNTSVAEQADVVVSTATTTTKWWFSAIPPGQIDIDWSPMITGSDPAAFLNNFRFDITKSFSASQGVPVHCTNSSGTTQLGVGFADLQITPNSCGCFLNGDLNIDDTNTFEVTPTTPTDLNSEDTYEFEYECNGSNDPTFTKCDPCSRLNGSSIYTSSACQ